MFAGKTLEWKTRWFQLCFALLFGGACYIAAPWMRWLAVDIVLFVGVCVAQAYIFTGLYHENYGIQYHLLFIFISSKDYQTFGNVKISSNEGNIKPIIQTISVHKGHFRFI